jgi:ATP-dependent DNA helicase RecG
MQMLRKILDDLEFCIKHQTYTPIETENIELKDGSNNGDWKAIYKSANAFLNSEGGIIIFGIKESNDQKKYTFTGYNEKNQENINNIATAFTDDNKAFLNVGAYLRPKIEPFMDGRVCVLYIENLPVHLKYAYYNGEAYERVMASKRVITESKLLNQKELKENFSLLRELKIVENATLQDLSIDALNDYIYEINKEIKLETPKTDIETAISFLEKKKFVINNQITTLGMLVCGKELEYFLGEKCQVACFVDSALEVVADKKILKDNVLALMTKTIQFVMKNIQVGISPKNGGQVVAEYPEKLLRESINNALAHRDYSQNKNTTVVIKPNQSIEIRNAGVFKKNVLIEHHKHEIPVLRIIPDVKRTNPLLADILRSYNQYEGRGTGISTIINDCLDNKIGLPYYKFHTENEMTLVIPKGKLLDSEMETLFKNYEGFIQKLTKYGDFSENHKLVLAYLLKSERENQKYRYTILLTADNNHLQAIGQLQAWNLIFAHPLSEPNKPIFLVHRQLLQTDFTDNLIEIFGAAYQNLPIIHKNCLQTIYQYENFAVEKISTASQLANILFAKQHAVIEQMQLQELDVFKRKVRSAVLLLQKKGFLEKKEKSLVIGKGN